MLRVREGLKDHKEQLGHKAVQVPKAARGLKDLKVQRALRAEYLRRVHQTFQRWVLILAPGLPVQLEQQGILQLTTLIED